MNIEDFRTYCLSFKGAYEKMPFEKATSAYDRNLLVFCVAEKWFCFVNVETFDFCNIKCAPDRIVDLQERYEGVTPAYHMNKKTLDKRTFRQRRTRQNDRRPREAIVRSCRGFPAEKGKSGFADPVIGIGERHQGDIRRRRKKTPSFLCPDESRKGYLDIDR